MPTHICFAAIAFAFWLPSAVLLAECCDQPSWIFNRGPYTHDPATGARVAQYMRGPAVEPLDDPREVTSRYRTSRTTLRGTNGSVDSTYEVQSWGNGRGGIDAEWERFHDAWLDSSLQGSYYNLNTPTPFPNQIYGSQPNYWGNGIPQSNFPQQGYPQGYGPWRNGHGPHRPWQNNGPPHQGFPQQGW